MLLAPGASGHDAANPIKILIVDDDPLLCGALTALLETQEDVSVVGAVHDGDEAVSAVQRLNPHVVLMDVRMRRMDGIDATSLVVGLPHPPRVIVLTTYDGDQVTLRSIAAGADGFLLKTASPDRILDAVRRVAAGQSVLASETAGQVLNHVRTQETRTHAGEAAAQLALLPPREREAVLLMAQGLTKQAIGRRMFVSESTVKTTLASAERRLGVSHRHELVVMVDRAGLLATHAWDEGAEKHEA